MAIVGLIPFVYATIKRKRRRSMARAAGCYAGFDDTGGTAARRDEHARGAYQSQSCHFSVRPSPEDDLGFWYDDYGAALCPPPKAEEHLSRGRGSARFDGGGYQSQSCRFAVRPSLLDELVVSRDDDGGSRRPPAQPERLSRQLLLPACRQDGRSAGATLGQERARSNGSAYQYQSQSCRFATAAYERGLSHGKEYGAASASPEDLSSKLLLPGGRSERGVSRSMRFSSMRVFAWVSGA